MSKETLHKYSRVLVYAILFDYYGVFVWFKTMRLLEMTLSIRLKMVVKYILKIVKY